MKRTQIQLDEATYESLRKRAFERHTSVAALLREAIQQYLTEPARRPRRASDFRFVGAGRSRQTPGRPVSEHHDEALETAYRE